jgi:hypothetical protein
MQNLNGVLAEELEGNCQSAHISIVDAENPTQEIQEEFFCQHQAAAR